jgi:hypothetical protein
MKRCALILTGLIAFTMMSNAQEPLIEASGSAQGRLDPATSLNELKLQLQEEAIKTALEETFGVAIGKWSDIRVSSGHAEVTIEGETFVRGEWIKTLQSACEEKWIGKKKKNRELWVTCSVKGLVRKNNKPLLPIYWQTARCPDDLCRTSEFRSGEPLIVTFKTPEDGWLTIYSVEKEGAFRLLPYQHQNSEYDHGIPVKADSLYTFFHADSQDFHANIDQLIMTTDYRYEELELYLVYSPEPLMPVPENGAAEWHESRQWILPAQVNTQQFLDWITENRIRSELFQVRRSKLRINGQ